ncbi:MAG: hypothetical protein IAE97_06370 [Chthoniobacterales bacterium]|nr:hypothetical protein [Chthoniobacterales bacterium]
MPNPFAGDAFAADIAELTRPRMKVQRGRLIAPGGTPKDVRRDATLKHFRDQGIDLTKMTPEEAARLEIDRFNWTQQAPGQIASDIAPGQPQSSTFAAPITAPQYRTLPLPEGRGLEGKGRDNTVRRNQTAEHNFGELVNNSGTALGRVAQRSMDRGHANPANDTRLAMPIRQMLFNNREFSNQWNMDLDRKNPDGGTMSFNQQAGEAGVRNPTDMPSSMTRTDRKGTKLTYTRGQGADGRSGGYDLTQAQYAANVSFDDGRGLFERTTFDKSGTKRTDYFDPGKHVGRMGATRGTTFEFADGRREVRDQSNRVVGTSGPSTNVLIDRGPDMPARQITANGASDVPRAQPVFAAPIVTPQQEGMRINTAAEARDDFAAFRTNRAVENAIAAENNGVLPQRGTAERDAAFKRAQEKQNAQRASAPAGAGPVAGVDHSWKAMMS